MLGAALLTAPFARAVVVEFHGTGTYNSGFPPTAYAFSVTFSYDTTATPIVSGATQHSHPGISLGLTDALPNGTPWSHTSTDVRIIMSNALNGGTTDGLTITTAWPLTETVPDFYAFEEYYPVVNYSLTLTEYSGGVFTNGDFSLPPDPTFIGDLSTWDVKHAKLYIHAAGNDLAVFNHPLGTLGAATAVPEPSTWAAILGAVGLGAVIWQRRRRRPAV